MASATRSKTSSKRKKSSNAPPYIRMVFEAIMHTHHAGKGVSRQKIANYMKANWDDIATGATFNAHLRKALQSGIERGVLVKGASEQRYKITDLGRKESKESNHSKKFDAEEEEKKAKKLAKKKKAEEKERKKKEEKKAAAKKKKEAEAKKKRKAAAAKSKKSSASSSKKKKTSSSASKKKKTSVSKRGSSKKTTPKAATRRSTRRTRAT